MSERDALRAWLALLSASSAIKKGVDAQLRQRFGVSISRFDVLAALDQAGEGGCSAGDLTARLRVTEGNTTQITTPLIAAGLVARSASPADGRVANFRLTPEGQRLFDRMAEENRALIAESFAALSPTDIATLRHLLAQLVPPIPAAREEAA